jgi:hypothetical protein
MAFEITSNTVVKLLVRRGDETDRTLTLLANGELGYSQDINRLFIGDGFTLGGKPVSNIFHGFVVDNTEYINLAQPGDLIYQTFDKTLYAFDGNSDIWRSISPSFGGFFEQIDGDWFLDNNSLGPAFTYNALAPDPNSLSNFTNRVDFNKNYLSLSAGYGSFYFGNIASRTVTNHLDATINVVDRLYINQEVSNPYQIQFHARSGDDDGAATIKLITEIPGDGNLYLKAPYEVSLYTDGHKLIRSWDGNYVAINYKDALGNFATPNLDINGFTRFRNSASIDQNLTITGNLSVYGETSYFETNVVTTSALSVINWNEGFVPLSVGQFSPTDNQAIAYFSGNNSDTNGRPVVSIKDGPFFGFSTKISDNATNTANFCVSGGAAFGYVSDVFDGFRVNAGLPGILLNTLGSLSSTLGNTYDLDLPSTHVTRADNYQLVAKSSDTSIPGVSIRNGNITSDYIGLEVHAGAGSRGIWVVPDANTTVYNTLIQSRDTAIIAKANANNTAALVLGVQSNAAYGIRIAADGDVGIGIADPGVYKLNVNGNTNISGTLRTTGALTITNGGASITGNVSVAGQITSTSDIIAFFTSDERLKQNIKVITSALDKVDQISGVEFDWDTEKQTLHTGHDIGVLAQEIEKVIPEAVTTRDDGYKAVKYEKIIPLLIEAIKELRQQITK